jgi:hypothetical protein
MIATFVCKCLLKKCSDLCCRTTEKYKGIKEA